MFTAFYLWATLHALFLGVAIPCIRANIANGFLSAFFLLTSLNVLFQHLLVFTDFRLAYPEFVFVSDAIGFCYGPVLYLYYRQLIFERFEWRQALHFVPAMAYVLYFFVVEMWFKGPFVFENYIHQNQHAVVLCLIVASTLSYLCLSLYSIKRNRNLRGVEEFKLISWLDLLIFVFLLKSVLNLFIFAFHAILGEEIFDAVRLGKDILFIGSTVAIIAAAQWYLMRHPQVILHGAMADADDDDTYEGDEPAVLDVPCSKAGVHSQAAARSSVEGTEPLPAPALDENTGAARPGVARPGAARPDAARPDAARPSTSNVKPALDAQADAGQPSGAQPSVAPEGGAENLPDAERNAERLEALMKQDKLYLDATLTEKALAEKLGVPSYYLSRLLNQVVGKRFNEYINEKRVEEAKRLLLAADSNNKTMFAISLDAGFKSESVFYTNFKKFTGVTPRVFKVKHAV
ncbi:helix-turn-helix domain-containing protein [Simiduia sp. 21SJ11W-1]|uniref:helix-turn-helix domain-containing protein n=1 Tax=Simiduia sp. 21SJ11W-1 TaxID=2909669 RepID=UPI0020A1940D|nr:helix-turn-helix domain-containing protein [Simiduia sp. 21SJ11W-1]UTA48311.1 helix-turn-helix domain-containing protein [Simiduia sp. 21SJ11W-1]